MRRISSSLAAMALFATAAAPVVAQQKAPAQPKPPTAQQKAPPQQKTTAAVVWTGTVVQPGSKGYSITLTLSGSGGETDYPELSCGGKLARVGTAGGFTFYLETITRGGIKQGGRCIDGSITTTPVADKLAWGWVGTHQNRTVVAHGMLQRR